MNFSPEEAGRYLGTNDQPVAVATLSWWRSKGKGPAFLKIGGRVMYTQAQLDAYKATCVRSPSQKVSS